MRQRRIIAAVSGTVVAGLFGVAAYAANPEPVVVEVEFVTPVTITEVSPLRFGLLDAGLANAETIVISTASGVTGTVSRVLGGTQAAANLTVAATGTQPINILVGNVSGNTGYTLGSFMCDYNAAGAAACDGVGGLDTTSAAAGSATLLVGATLTGTGGAGPGVFNGSFDVTVAYQ